MIKKSLSFLSLLAVSIVCLPCISCDNDSTMPFPPTSKTNIRLHNVSDFDFRGVEVHISDSPTNYGDLKSGEKSEYRAFDVAYSYAYVRLFVGDAELIIQPIDFVGETPLGPGYFTYELDVENLELRGLTIHTVKDN